MTWSCIGSKKAAIEYWYPNEPVHRLITKFPPIAATCIPLHQRMEIFGSVSHLVSAGNPAYNCDTFTRVTHGGSSYNQNNYFWEGVKFVWSPVIVATATNNRSVYCTDRAAEFKDTTVTGDTRIIVECHGRADDPINYPPTQSPVIVEIFNQGERSPILNWNLNFIPQRDYVYPFSLPSIFQIWDRRGVIYKRTSYAQGCPNWRFICEGKCPRGTCEVKCGKYVCCYDNKGDAVYQYQPL